MLEKAGPSGHNMENFQKEVETATEFRTSTIADVASAFALEFC